MSDPSIHPARVLAALEVLGWPDDREHSAHVEPDGYEVTSAGHYWETVEAVIRAADAAGGRPSTTLVIYEPPTTRFIPVPVDPRTGRMLA